MQLKFILMSKIAGRKTATCFFLFKITFYLQLSTYNYKKNNIYFIWNTNTKNRSGQSNYQYRKTKQSQICSLKIRRCKKVGLQVIRISRVNGPLVDIFLKPGISATQNTKHSSCSSNIKTIFCFKIGKNRQNTHVLVRLRNRNKGRFTCYNSNKAYFTRAS